MDAQETNPDSFFDNFAELRRLLVNPSARNRLLIRESGHELTRLAKTSSEEALAHAMLVLVGAEVGDDSTKNTGIQALHSLSNELLLEALNAIVDMTYLGRHDQRWGLIKRLCVIDDDLGLLFIEEPSFGGAAELVASQWSPDRSLPPWLQRELRLQVGWKALELALDTADSRALDLVDSKSLGGRRDEAGWWEYEMQRAANALIRSRLSEGVQRLELLLRNSPPEWTRARIRFDIVRFAPLAVDLNASWIRCCPGGLPAPPEAPSTALAAAAAVAAVLETPQTGKPGMLGRVNAELSNAPWMTFGLFLEPNLRDAIRDELGKLLVAMPDRKFASLPWEGRELLFATACTRYGDSDAAVGLLLRADAHLSNVAYATAIAQIIESNGIELLQSLDLDRITTFFNRHPASCPESLRAILARGGITRAVVDGSNVMWGTRKKAPGVAPKFTHLADAWNQLNAAGYLDIRIFVDARTEHQLSHQDRELLQKWRNEYRVSQVEREADPHIINYFLKDPEHSEIVTGDLYRDWIKQPDYSPLKNWWPQRRRSFHVDQHQRIVFNVPLTRRIPQ